jgi:radical SAM protein with 4Fe4S-binding SPASM domain
MDLTDRCNLDCVHCYVKQNTSPSEEATTKQVLSYIDQSADQGCLFLLLTGGEPLLRSDFQEIYEYAKCRGILVSIFTNGTLIDDTIADFLADLPPYSVEISIYGASAETHDNITGVKGSFQKTMIGFQLLKEHGINTTLKTILMTLNKHEIKEMLELSKDEGVKFRVDGAIFPRLDGDKTPMQFRLTPEEVVEAEFMLPDREKTWHDFLDKAGRLEPSDVLYDCGAGISCFHITSHGRLKPCIMAPGPVYDLNQTSFNDAWEQMTEIRNIKAGPDYPCSNCKDRLICDSCPGFFGLENGDEKMHSSYVCKIAGERAKKM